MLEVFNTLLGFNEEVQIITNTILGGGGSVL